MSKDLRYVSVSIDTMHVFVSIWINSKFGIMTTSRLYSLQYLYLYHQ